MAIANTAPNQLAYPAEVSFSDTGLERSRLTVFFRYFLAIPVEIVVVLYAIAFVVTSFLAWVAILFTGKYPSGLYSFGVGYMRLVTDLYAYMHYVTDEYPPFSGNDAKAAGYASQYVVDYPGHSSRVTVFFRALLAIPSLIFGMIVWIAMAVVAFVAWFAILFTGKYPEGMLRFVEGALRSIMRINSYYSYMTDQYPPFSFS